MICSYSPHRKGVSCEAKTLHITDPATAPAPGLGPATAFGPASSAAAAAPAAATAAATAPAPAPAATPVPVTAPAAAAAPAPCPASVGVTDWFVTYIGNCVVVFWGLWALGRPQRPVKVSIVGGWG